MDYDSGNVFAKILRGELPCIKVYEDAHTLAMMDIMPQADGHVLVLPKEGAVTLPELSSAAAAAAIQTTQKLVRAVRQGMNTEGVLVMQVNGATAGQTVPHVHFHVIPSSVSAVLRGHASRQEDPARLEQFAAQIRAALAASG